MSKTELAQALAECRACLEAELSVITYDSKQDGAIDALGDVVTRFATLSRQSQLTPEHALVMFKTTVNGLHATGRWPTMEREALTRELVPILIAAFYQRGNSSPR
jgi:hypothetical protein